LAPIAVRLLLGQEFESSVPVLRWMSAAIPFAFLNGLLSAGLQSANHQRLDGLLTTGRLCVNVALNWALIPPLGAVGAACALVISEILCLFAKGMAFMTRGLPQVRQESGSPS